MTRLLVVSDSHDSTAMLEFAAQMAEDGEYRHIIHLGDVCKDAEWLAERLNRPIVSVAGNCDFFSKRQREETLEVEKVKILLTHGHLFGVKTGLGALSYRADELGCKLAFFGHTHTAYSGYVGGALLVNPGALMGGKCAVIEIDGDKVTPKLTRV